MSLGFRLSSHPFLSTSYLEWGCRVAGWYHCVFSSRDNCMARAVTWARAKARAQQHPHDDRAAVWGTGDEAERSKFLESCNVTLCPPPTQWNWGTQIYCLCLHLGIKAIPQRKKVVLLGFFSAIITILYWLWLTAWTQCPVMQIHQLQLFMESMKWLQVTKGSCWGQPQKERSPQVRLNW